ncbi:MAG TPA: GNAT family protein [Gaiellaceae bacterium]|nr:GNAT family protein [Gaiellaceae bacterium]
MSWEGPPPPYRIETERLVLRCYGPRDAALVKDAIDSSLDHLRPWMPWVEHEPQTLEEKTDLLKSFRSQFDLGDNFVMGIFSADESEVLGGSGLHPRVEPGGLEIGYFIRASATRQGYVTESTAALTRVGFEICGADRIEIRIDPENETSKDVPRKLGYVEEATLRRRLPGRAGGPLRDVTIFTMFHEDFDPSLAPGIRAFDGRGERVL